MCNRVEEYMSAISEILRQLEHYFTHLHIYSFTLLRTTKL